MPQSRPIPGLLAEPNPTRRLPTADNLRYARARGRILSEFRTQFTNRDGIYRDVDQATFKTQRTEDGKYNFQFTVNESVVRSAILRKVGEASFSGTYDPETKTATFQDHSNPPVADKEPKTEPETELKDLLSRWKSLIEDFQQRLDALFGRGKIDEPVRPPVHKI